MREGGCGTEGGDGHGAFAQPLERKGEGVGGNEGRDGHGAFAQPLERKVALETYSFTSRQWGLRWDRLYSGVDPGGV